MSLHFKPVFVILERTISKTNVSIENKRVPVPEESYQALIQGRNEQRERIIATQGMSL